MYTSSVSSDATMELNLKNMLNDTLTKEYNKTIDDIMEEQSNICQIINILNPEVWFNGHYHTSFEKTITNGTKVTCLDILEIRKLIA